MSIRIRSTEQHPHPIWTQLLNEFCISEIQGFLFECTDNELIEATKTASNCLQIHCLEAVEYDEEEEFYPLNIFTFEEWSRKFFTARFFKCPLLLLAHKKQDAVLMRLFEVQEIQDSINFSLISVFPDENSLIEWWKEIKRLTQTKATVEAAPRQRNTVIDNILSRHNLAWGGNVDGFILTNDKLEVKAIIEIRQTRSFSLDHYDPANYFTGTKTKGGDFKTWLPLIYLKKAYHIPLILITLSAMETNRFGFTEVFSINHRSLFYVDQVPPTQNVTDDFSVFKTWLLQRI